MRKISQILTAAVFSVAFVSAGALSNNASAAPCDGNISVSGNNSSVTVNCSDIQSVVIKCVDNVNIATINYQNGQSGTATVSGNGSNGNASTGAVINTNDSAVNATAACAATPDASTTPTPTPSTTPTPGKGSVTPAALPNTASNSALTIVAGSLVAAAAIVVGSRLAVAAYRRISTK